jgi:hypothetical protein
LTSASSSASSATAAAASATIPTGAVRSFTGRRF